MKLPDKAETVVAAAGKRPNMAAARTVQVVVLHKARAALSIPAFPKNLAQAGLHTALAAALLPALASARQMAEERPQQLTVLSINILSLTAMVLLS
ncbi:MAG: hypothetical protein HQL01_15865 [Nitrospirae bacterium]|nr:hypothetical protein [Nitrospirota bacterium]